MVDSHVQVIRDRSEQASLWSQLSTFNGIKVLRGDGDESKLVLVQIHIYPQTIVFSNMKPAGRLLLQKSKTLWFEAHLDDAKVRVELPLGQWGVQGLEVPWPPEIHLVQRRKNERVLIQKLEWIFRVADRYFPILDLSFTGTRLEVYHLQDIDYIQQFREGVLIGPRKKWSLWFRVVWKRKLMQYIPIPANQRITHFFLQNRFIQNAEDFKEIGLVTFQVGLEFKETPQKVSQELSELIQIMIKENIEHSLL